MTEHAVISPSALHRLLHCTASLHLSEGIADRTSIHAATGTVGHHIIEVCAKSDVPPEDFLGDVFTADGYEIEVDEDMVEGANLWLDRVRPHIQAADVVWIERRVHLDKLWHPNPPPATAFGTADALFYYAAERHLHVKDFKFGIIPVSPYENPQALAYALGAIWELGAIPRWVTITIVQPRGMWGEPAIKEWKLPGMDILLWAKTVLRPKVDEMFDPLARKLETGDWCRFCPAKPRCPALYALAKRTARMEFGDLPPEPKDLDNAELSHALNEAAVIKSWLDAVAAEALARMDLNGQDVPGWKLVPKRAVRKWSDEDAVIAEIRGRVDNDALDKLLPVKPLSPAQMEKADKALYQGTLKNYVEAKSSGKTLAPEVDPRDALEATRQSAAQDFA